MVGDGIRSLACWARDLGNLHGRSLPTCYGGSDYIRYAMSQMRRFCLEVASVLRTLRRLDVPDVAFPSEPVDRLWHASLQMLEDAKEHFVMCRPAEATGVDTIVHELRAALDSSDVFRECFDRTGLAQEYHAQIRIWEEDHSAREVCTATEQ